MYTSDFKIEGDYYRAHHNGDFSGDVIIELREEEIEPIQPVNGSLLVRIPFDLLKSIVAKWARNALISHLENVDDDELLLGRPQAARCDD